jgi:hypothetical protein
LDGFAGVISCILPANGASFPFTSDPISFGLVEAELVEEYVTNSVIRFVSIGLWGQ